jgi:hypothetical protein
MSYGFGSALAEKAFIFWINALVSIALELTTLAKLVESSFRACNPYSLIYSA